jgi:hypothetical protein
VITRDRSRQAGARQRALPLREARFLAAIASAASADATRIARIGAALVGAPDPLARFRSRLNNDGSPLQACASLRRARPVAWRLLGDPFSDFTDATERFLRTRRRARAIIARYTDAGFARIVDSAVDAAIAPEARSRNAVLCPSDRGTARGLDAAVPLSVLSRGSMWVGVPLAGRGAAIYVNGRVHDDRVAWERVSRWMRALTGSSIAERIRLEWSGRAELASIGVEGADADTAQIKLYFRLGAAIPLSDFAANASQRAALATFVECLAGDAALPRHGILVGLGVSARSGVLTDVKLDLCGHCLAFDAGSFAHALRAVETAFGLPEETLSAMKIGERSDVAFVGCGVSISGEPRVNVYFKHHDASGA